MPLHVPGLNATQALDGSATLLHDLTGYTDRHDLTRHTPGTLVRRLWSEARTSNSCSFPMPLGSEVNLEVVYVPLA